MAAVAMPTWVNRLWTFVRREWPLCIFAALAVFVVYDGYYGYEQPSRGLAGLVLAGLAGGLFCLKRFGLDHCPWVYLLAALLTLPTGISLEDAQALRAAYAPLRNWHTLSISLMFGSLRGMLAAVPFSLFFLRKLPGCSAFWKIPLSVFFLILALKPLFITLAAIILMSFTSCP